MDDEDAIARREHLDELGRDHDDRDAVAGKLAHERMDLRLGTDIHAPRGFVEEEDPRGGRGPTTHDHLLLVATRERGHHSLRVRWRQGEALHHRLDRGQLLRAW